MFAKKPPFKILQDYSGTPVFLKLNNVTILGITSKPDCKKNNTFLFIFSKFISTVVKIISIYHRYRFFASQPFAALCRMNGKCLATFTTILRIRIGLENDCFVN